MKNFPVIIDNKEYWISRSVSVSGFIFTHDNGLRILACKRGKGCPDNVGKWNCPSGYLDYDETVIDACCREIREETGLVVKPKSLTLYGYNDVPEGKQNITFLFFGSSDYYAGHTISNAFCEPDEVDEVEWISIKELNNYDWAYNHNKLIATIALEFEKIYLSTDEKDSLMSIINNSD